MACEKIQDLLSEYLDSELSEEERTRVAEHVSECETCAEELRTMQRTVATLHSLPRHAAPADMADRVRRELEQESREAVPNKVIEIWPRALAVAAMFAVVIGVTLLLHESGLMRPSAKQFGRMAMERSASPRGQLARDRAEQTEPGAPSASAGREVANAGAKEMAPDAETSVVADQARPEREEATATTGGPGVGGRSAMTMRAASDEMKKKADSDQRETAAALKARKLPRSLEEVRTSGGPHQVMRMRSQENWSRALDAVQSASARGLQKAELAVGRGGELNLTLVMQGDQYQAFVEDLLRNQGSPESLRNTAQADDRPYFRMILARYRGVTGPGRDVLVAEGGATSESRRRPTAEKKAETARESLMAERAEEPAREEEARGDLAKMPGMRPPSQVELLIRYVPSGRRSSDEATERTDE